MENASQFDCTSDISSTVCQLEETVFFGLEFEKLIFGGYGDIILLLLMDVSGVVLPRNVGQAKSICNWKVCLSKCDCDFLYSHLGRLAAKMSKCLCIHISIKVIHRGGSEVNVEPDLSFLLKKNSVYQLFHC